MSDDRIIPTPAPADRPSLTLESDGSPVSGTYQVLTVVVERRFNKVAAADVVLYDGDPAQEDFPASNADEFAPGREIEIYAGYHGDEALLFKGHVVRHGIQAHKQRPSLLRLECKDVAVKLTVGRKNAYFYDVTDSDVMEAIAGTAGLDTDVASTGVTHAEIVQYQTLDWDFIVTRAEANGLLVSTDDGTLRIQPPGFDQEPVLALRYGGNLIGFEAVMDARDQYTAVQAHAWDAANQELLALEASDPGATTPGNVEANALADVVGLSVFDLNHAGQLTDAELQAWADAQLLKSRLAKVRGRARIQGVAGVKPGTLIDLAGVGERFGGTAFVSGVRHELNIDNWETDVEFGLSPDWFVEEYPGVSGPRAGALLPAVEGLQIGLVTALEGDPEGEYRVQVRIPMIDATEEGVWARVATLDAGDARGSFFRPEIGDEVVLDFLHGDPRNPIILGMLNSSAKPAPLDPSDDNHEKGFVTRSEMKVLFDDDKQEMTLVTPNGNTVVLSDDDGSITLQDENDNKVVLSSDGITLESASDITLKASGDVKLEGTNVESSANAQFKAEGSAGAEFSSGGTTVLSGALVQIN